MRSFPAMTPSLLLLPTLTLSALLISVPSANGVRNLESEEWWSGWAQFATHSGSVELVATRMHYWHPIDSVY
jgi:hypothetical protein